MAGAPPGRRPPRALRVFDVVRRAITSARASRAPHQLVLAAGSKRSDIAIAPGPRRWAAEGVEDAVTVAKSSAQQRRRRRQLDAAAGFVAICGDRGLLSASHAAPKKIPGRSSLGDYRARRRRTAGGDRRDAESSRDRVSEAAASLKAAGASKRGAPPGTAARARANQLEAPRHAPTPPKSTTMCAPRIRSAAEARRKSLGIPDRRHAGRKSGGGTSARRQSASSRSSLAYFASPRVKISEANDALDAAHLQRPRRHARARGTRGRRDVRPVIEAGEVVAKSEAWRPLMAKVRRGGGRPTSRRAGSRACTAASAASARARRRRARASRPRTCADRAAARAGRSAAEHARDEAAPRRAEVGEHVLDGAPGHRGGDGRELGGWRRRRAGAPTSRSA